MKDSICIGVGVIGSFVASWFGGFDEGLITLTTFMIIDYVTGLLCAGVFHNSPKTEGGALESNAGYKGLCRKGMTLLIVLIAHRLDLTMHTTYLRDAVVIGFIANESISIIENAGLMGLPLPKPLEKAIEVLKHKSENVEGE